MSEKQVLDELQERKAQLIPNAKIAMNALSHLNIEDACDALRSAATLLESKAEVHKELFMKEKKVADVTS